ncbi:GYD domain-containing protein [Candidatus Hecatella orcuttiae]|jgi:uncharacterized protein with GYD domain|uniref:GYD domain-containing protein n=1 Tax=Candidatus Hecatella orcuttiae TaxID=1935119 RepID=UPI002867C666|nr:GYD domain-containing protein [Candidatus Hecatella orcuttiae]
MSTYIILGRYTREGITNIKDHPRRREEAQKAFKAVGGEIKDFYFTLGRYDFVAVCEAPGEEAALKALLTIGSVGAVSTETLVAVPRDKAAEIIRGLP